MLPWLRAQLAAAGVALWGALGGALLLAVWRRTLHGRAVAAGLLSLLAGWLVLIGIEVARARVSALAVLPHAFFVGLLAAAVAGARVARRTRHLSGLELQAVWLAGGLLLTLVLRQPVAHLRLGHASPWSPPVGEAHFGPLWDRILGLYVACGFAVSLWGASMELTFGAHAPGAKRVPMWRWSLEWLLLRRALGAQRGQSLPSTTGVATMGVALGVAALITVTAVMSGYQHDIEGRILGTNAHVVVQKYGSDFVESARVTQTLAAIDGVEAAAPFAFNEAILAAGGKSHGVLLKGVTPAATAVTGIGAQLCDQVIGQGAHVQCVRGAHALSAEAASARLAALAGPPGRAGVIVGRALFTALDVPIGAAVQLMTPASLSAGGHAAPRRERFMVRGVFDSGMHEFDSHLAYVALPAAQRLLGLGATVSGVEIRLDDPHASEARATAILDALGHYPYRALDWRALNGSIFTAIALQKAAMFVLLSFIVVVASFNIASTLLMAAMQKAKDVAVLKSLGTREQTVLRLFVFEGLAIASMGCALGLTLGLGTSVLLSQLHLSIAADVYMVGALSLRLDWREIAGTIALAFAICQVASLVPALRAAAQSPMQLFDDSL